MDRGADPAARVLLAGRRRGRRAIGVDAEVTGDPQDAEHVRRVRHEHRIVVMPRCCSFAATERSDSSVCPAPVLPEDRGAAGPPWSIAYARATAASVVRSPGSLPPVTTRYRGDPARAQLRPRGRGGPRRSATDGRRTGPRRARRSRRPAVARRGDPAARSGTSANAPTAATARAAVTMIRRTRSLRPGTASGRPWHFLYFWPDPHQHGSLRPIRAPDGVNPGRTLAARARVAGGVARAAHRVGREAASRGRRGTAERRTARGERRRRGRLRDARGRRRSRRRLGPVRAVGRGAVADRGAERTRRLARARRAARSPAPA